MKLDCLNGYSSMKLKAYTKKFGLIKSHEFKDIGRVYDLLVELCNVTEVKAAFLVDGRNSRKINFTFQKQKIVPNYYIRSDGIKTKTLSVHPENYPMRAVYADGKIEILKLG